MHEFPKFLFRLAIFSLLLAMVMYIFIPSVPLKFQLQGWWKLICFFFITTSLFHFGLLKSIQNRAASITIYYMAGTTIKLLLYVGIMIGYSALYKQSSIAFMLTFFMIYFLFTIFEVGILYKKFSQPLKKDSAA